MQCAIDLLELRILQESYRCNAIDVHSVRCNSVVDIRNIRPIRNTPFTLPLLAGCIQNGFNPAPRFWCHTRRVLAVLAVLVTRNTTLLACFSALATSPECRWRMSFSLPPSGTWLALSLLRCGTFSGAMYSEALFARPVILQSKFEHGFFVKIYQGGPKILSVIFDAQLLFCALRPGLTLILPYHHFESAWLWSTSAFKSFI